MDTEAAARSVASFFREESATNANGKAHSGANIGPLSSMWGVADVAWPSGWNCGRWPAYFQVHPVPAIGGLSGWRRRHPGFHLGWHC